MKEDKDSKTEEPTHKKIEDARKKGQVAKSQELNTFIIILVAFIFLTFYLLYFLEYLIGLSREILSLSAEYQLDIESTYILAEFLFEKLAILMTPFFLILLVAGLLSNIWQNNGLLFSIEPLKPKLKKINPMTGLKRIIGKDGLMNLFKALAKLLIIGGAIFSGIFNELATLPILLSSSPAYSLTVLGEGLFILFVKALCALLLIAIIDLIYQKWSYKENLKMSKKEVKDERKQQEGDPLIKSRIRQRQYQISKQRLLEAVPNATVVITNPTHISIAIRYQESDVAPVVVAKGKGFIALKIREIAAANEVFIIEDKHLAQTLFKTVDVGASIPAELYKSVAKILAYVYRLENMAV